MNGFLKEDFLLSTGTAKRLYVDYAAGMPIIDYHNHLPPQEIAENKPFENMTALWLKGDHYKWRALRANGIEEKYITGNATDAEKFAAWAATVPYTMRNPLYHWTAMELKNPFGITASLNENTAAEIYAQCNAQLSHFTPQQLLLHYKVEMLCTTDDPTDSLVYHQQIKSHPFGVRVLPTFRADKVLLTADLPALNNYFKTLGEVSNIAITSFESLMVALKARHTYFHDMGCRLSDNGIDTFYAADFTVDELEKIFVKILAQSALTAAETNTYRAAVLYYLCTWNHEKQWAQQFHVGAIRNNNTRLLRTIGADAGVDSIGDWQVAQGMSRFFDKLDETDQLAKTIVYNLNPAYNEVFAAMIGNFQGGGIAGKMQYGSAWWFLDQEDGMEKQINVLSNFGLLSRFVGMLTDSRSFLSYSRHEYFRRILCNLIGKDVESGRLPNDEAWLGKMIQAICFHNAKAYFNC
ncbi:glucuronate isomerase [Chitinophaga skermanii]|uniref:Uronate isomerase n=1 Tax=Chitinophaga skermanii TaxID=331697 RepID=A0A327R4Q6_9BACT|nr:glucuronate isomerase [Chitinophaga skermanii]RAJ11048.1 glucuronate isomerase [Chitinophaga skermanii]